MSFIKAMGASHTNVDRLKNIINIMESRETNRDYEPAISVIHDTMDKYGVDISNVPIYNFIPYVGEEKFDGFSYLNINGRFISKSVSQAKGMEGTPIDKTGWIPHLADDMKYIYEKTGCDIHGEIHIPGTTSDTVTSILGCTPEEAISRQVDNRLHFTWLDIRAVNGKSLINEPYYIRRAILESLFYTFYGPAQNGEYIHISPITLMPIRDFRRIVNSGGEGLVFKNTSGLYVPDKKPVNNWIKCKKKITLDVAIIGYNNDGTGKNAGLFKSIQIGMMVDGRIQYVGNVHSGISDELRREMHENRDEFINRVIEVEAMDMNQKDGNISLRHARLIRFRPDKIMDECTTDGVQIRML